MGRSISPGLSRFSETVLPGAWTTTGLEPTLWLGKRSLRRSVAFWLPVPGSERLVRPLLEHVPVDHRMRREPRGDDFGGR